MLHGGLGVAVVMAVLLLELSLVRSIGAAVRHRPPERGVLEVQGPSAAPVLDGAGFHRREGEPEGPQLDEC